MELTNDEESCVRLAGLETVVLILSLLDEGTDFGALYTSVLHCVTTLRSLNRYIDCCPSNRIWFNLKYIRIFLNNKILLRKLLTLTLYKWQNNRHKMMKITDGNYKSNR